MSRTIPLIRLAALTPFLRWAEVNRRDLRQMLSVAGLATLPCHDTGRPISFHAAAAFARELQRREGPDTACRVVSALDLRDLGAFSRLTLGSRNPGRALKRLAPCFGTHEHFSVSHQGDRLVLRMAHTLRLDPETRHLVQQYAAALVHAICVAAGASAPAFERLELAPHPEFGVAHLAPWFGLTPRSSTDAGLLVTIPRRVADRPFPASDRPSEPFRLPREWRPLRGDGTLAGSARTVVSQMLEDGTSSVEQLATAGGMPIRSLQRRLSNEGTSYKALLEDVRRELAIKFLTDREGPAVGEVAAILGYSSQAALTRAVRRWTGTPPRTLRNRREG